MSTIYLTVEENSAPNIDLILQRNSDRIDVTGATVVLVITNKAGTVVNTGHQTCTITDATQGEVTYAVNAADFANPGTYNAEVKITYANNTVERLYEVITIVARRKLA